MTSHSIEYLFEYCRKVGFPYYRKDDYDLKEEFNKLTKFNCYDLMQGKKIGQTMHGLGLLWCYFPHSFDVKCNNLLSPLEVFNNDDTLMRAIAKVKKHAPNFSESSLRKRLRTFSGAQGVSNFRPSSAQCIYDHYAGEGIVWDMSGGYGGRMFGAVTSKSVRSYTCTEPCALTAKGLNEFKDDVAHLHNKEVNVVQSGSEDYLPEKGSLDLCFTSPPYFDCEKYSDEDTQSWKKFPNRDEWMDGFFKKTMENCVHGLKDNGVLIINIANVKSYGNICDHINDVITGLGMTHHDTLQYALSSINAGGFKYEPTYVYTKGEIVPTAYERYNQSIDVEELFE